MLAYFRPGERWPSGRRRSPAKRVYGQKSYRGFESHPLRQLEIIQLSQHVSLALSAHLRGRSSTGTIGTSRARRRSNRRRGSCAPQGRAATALRGSRPPGMGHIAFKEGRSGRGGPGSNRGKSAECRSCGATLLRGGDIAGHVAVEGGTEFFFAPLDLAAFHRLRDGRLGLFLSVVSLHTAECARLRVWFTKLLRHHQEQCFRRYRDTYWRLRNDLAIDGDVLLGDGFDCQFRGY